MRGIIISLRTTRTCRGKGSTKTCSKKSANTWENSWESKASSDETHPPQPLKENITTTTTANDNANKSPHANWDKWTTNTIFSRTTHHLSLHITLNGNNNPTRDTTRLTLRKCTRITVPRLSGTSQGSIRILSSRERLNRWGIRKHNRGIRCKLNSRWWKAGRKNRSL